MNIIGDLATIPSELSAAPPNLDYVKSVGYRLRILWPIQKASPASHEVLILQPADDYGTLAYGSPLPLHALALCQIQWGFY